MKTQQLGLSLAELLIALFLSTFIIINLMQLYLNSKKQYLLAQKRLMDNFEKQWIENLLIDSIRQAGFSPCMGLSSLKINDRREIPGSVVSLVVNSVKQELTLRRMHEHFNRVITIYDKKQLLVSKDYPLSMSDPIMVADCLHAEIHQPSKITQTQSGQLITLKKSLFYDYQSVTWLGEWVEEKWFIGKNRKDAAVLYYQRNKAVELSALITSLEMARRGKVMEVQVGTREPLIVRMRQV